MTIHLFAFCDRCRSKIMSTCPLCPTCRHFFCLDAEAALAIWNSYRPDKSEPSNDAALWCRPIPWGARLVSAPAKRSVGAPQRAGTVIYAAIASELAAGRSMPSITALESMTSFSHATVVTWRNRWKEENPE